MTTQPLYNLKKITIRQAQKLINEQDGLEDVDFKNTYHNIVYRLKNGKVILWFDTHAFLYDSLGDLLSYMDYLNKKRGHGFITHILQGKLLYPDNFDHHENELIDDAIRTFNIKRYPPSLEGVKQIERFINTNSKIKIDKHLFSQVLAYVGRVMIDNLPEAKWELIQSKDDKSIQEPFVISTNRLYNPFFFVYRELYETLPEERKINLYDSMVIEMGKYPSD